MIDWIKDLPIVLQILLGIHWAGVALSVAFLMTSKDINTKSRAGMPFTWLVKLIAKTVFSLFWPICLLVVLFGPKTSHR